MSLFIVQIIAFIVGIIGTGLTIVVTALAQWRLYFLVEGNAVRCNEKRIDGQWLSRWDGLWLTCVSQYNNIRDDYLGTRDNPVECHYYPSLVTVTIDLKVGRILMVFAIVVAIIALILAAFGLLCFGCCRRSQNCRYCLLLTAGIGFILATILVIIPIAWCTVRIIQERNNPLCKSKQRLEIGEAVYLGWITLFFLLISGLMFIFYRFCEDEEEKECKNVVTSSQTSFPRPVYVPCERVGRTPSQSNYSRSQYI